MCGQPGLEAGNFTFSVVRCLKYWTMYSVVPVVVLQKRALFNFAQFATSLMCLTLLFQVKTEHICEVAMGPDKFPMYLSFSGLCPQKALQCSSISLVAV